MANMTCAKKKKHSFYYILTEWCLFPKKNIVMSFVVELVLTFLVTYFLETLYMTFLFLNSYQV